MKTHFLLSLFGLLALALAACAPATPAAPPFSLAAALPGDSAVAGWTISEKVETYTPDNLFDLVDGQADAFFVYNFEQVATQRYTNTAGIMLNIEIWQLAAPADAFGLFTMSRAGTPIEVGNGGDTDPGRRLAFWQNRYYVHVNANRAVPDAELQAFAQSVATALPAGGEPPALVQRLPATGLQERSFIFFRQELSLQNEIWLGGENILGLSKDTQGVAARYTLDSVPARLLLIQYPAAAQAAAGLKALQAAPDTELVTAESRDTLLGAVFGKAGQAAAAALVQDALK